MTGLSSETRSEQETKQKCTAPTVTMATDKGRRCRAELGEKRREDGKDKRGRKRERPLLLLSFLFSLCSLSTCKVISTGYTMRDGREGGDGGR